MLVKFMNHLLQHGARRLYNTMVKARVFLYAKPFEGFPQETNFKLVEEELPPIKDGEFLIEAEYLSVDPYMRAFGHTIPVGTPFSLGVQVGRIAESKNSQFPVGKHIIADLGWRSHTIANGITGDGMLVKNPTLLPDFGNLPSSLALGVVGNPGNTAYFGLLELINPKPGETIVVSGAAGAVGNIAGQISKIKGCTVIGIAGSKEKGEWLVKELGFDHFIDYKTEDIDKRLKELAPQGIDGYFDNVAGDISTAVVKNMNLFGRIAVCGIISTHNEDDPQAGYSSYFTLRRQLRIEGYNVRRWQDRYPESQGQLLKWVQEGKLKYRETVTQGFENMPKAFIDLYKGGNTGKAIVKA